MFETKSDLTAWLDSNGFAETESGSWYIKGPYCLAHGEYSQPDYYPRRYKNGWSLYVQHHYYQGTFNTPEDGRVPEEFYSIMEYDL